MKWYIKYSFIISINKILFQVFVQQKAFSLIHKIVASFIDASIMAGPLLQNMIFNVVLEPPGIQLFKVVIMIMLYQVAIKQMVQLQTNPILH